MCVCKSAKESASNRSQPCYILWSHPRKPNPPIPGQLLWPGVASGLPVSSDIGTSWCNWKLEVHDLGKALPGSSGMKAASQKSALRFWRSRSCDWRSEGHGAFAELMRIRCVLRGEWRFGNNTESFCARCLFHCCRKTDEQNGNTTARDCQSFSLVLLTNQSSQL